VFTAIVIGSVAITGLLIWVVDAVVTRVLEFVLD
jgi:preprotein translocase subunit SecE